MGGTSLICVVSFRALYRELRFNHGALGEKIRPALPRKAPPKMAAEIGRSPRIPALHAPTHNATAEATSSNSAAVTVPNTLTKRDSEIDLV